VLIPSFVKFYLGASSSGVLRKIKERSELENVRRVRLSDRLAMINKETLERYDEKAAVWGERLTSRIRETALTGWRRKSPASAQNPTRGGRASLWLPKRAEKRKIRAKGPPPGTLPSATSSKWEEEKIRPDGPEEMEKGAGVFRLQENVGRLSVSETGSIELYSLKLRGGRNYQKLVGGFSLKKAVASTFNF